MSENEQNILAVLEGIRQQQEQIIHLLEEQLYISCCLGQKGSAVEQPREQGIAALHMQNRARELKETLDNYYRARNNDLSALFPKQS